MKFYKVTTDIKNNFWFKINKGDILCNSFYYGWVKCASNKNRTEHFLAVFNYLDYIEAGILIPLDRWDLVKLEPHLKKEMRMFDLPYSLKNNEFKTLEEVRRIKERVRKYKKNGKV